MFQAKFVQKLKTQILYSTTFSENRVVSEIMWTDMVGANRPQIAM